MQKFLSCLALVVLLGAGCGGVNEKEINDSFHRYGENFTLRLQKQLFDPATAPVDLTVKIAPKPEYILERPTAAGQPFRGQLKLQQTEISSTGELDRLVIYKFVRGPQGWKLEAVVGQVLEKRRVSRGKGITEPGNGEQTDLLADEVFAPHIRAAIAATPPE
jgi:hypothetical protein